VFSVAALDTCRTAAVANVQISGSPYIGHCFRTSNDLNRVSFFNLVSDSVFTFFNDPNAQATRLTNSIIQLVDGRVAYGNLGGNLRFLDMSSTPPLLLFSQLNSLGATTDVLKVIQVASGASVQIVVAGGSLIRKFTVNVNSVTNDNTLTPATAINDIIFLAEDSLLVSSHSNGQLIKTNSVTLTQVGTPFTLSGTPIPTKLAATCPAFFAVAYSDFMIRIFENNGINDFSLTMTLTGNTVEITGLVFLSTNYQLVSGSTDNVLRVYNLNSATVSQVINFPAESRFIGGLLEIPGSDRFLAVGNISAVMYTNDCMRGSPCPASGQPANPADTHLLPNTNRASSVILKRFNLLCLSIICLVFANLVYEEI